MTREIGHAVVVSLLFGGAVTVVAGCADLVGADFREYKASAKAAEPAREGSETEPAPTIEEDGGSSGPAPDGGTPKSDATTPKAATKKCEGTATACGAFATDMTNCQ